MEFPLKKSLLALVINLPLLRACISAIALSGKPKNRASFIGKTDTTRSDFTFRTCILRRAIRNFDLFSELPSRLLRSLILFRKNLLLSLESFFSGYMGAKVIRYLHWSRRKIQIWRNCDSQLVAFKHSPHYEMKRLWIVPWKLQRVMKNCCERVWKMPNTIFENPTNLLPLDMKGRKICRI